MSELYRDSKTWNYVSHMNAKKLRIVLYNSVYLMFVYFLPSYQETSVIAHIIHNHSP